MTDEEIINNIPCKCNHDELSHYIVEQSYGWNEYDHTTGVDRYMEEVEPLPVCGDCNKQCIFDRMTALEYIQWKYENTL